MSLLLDALKKAEKAKEDARRRAQSAGGVEPDAADYQVRTRSELPDISSPLEMNSGGIEAVADSGSAVPDAFSTAPVRRTVAEAHTAPPAREPASDAIPRQRQPVPQAENAPDPQSVQRTAAKKVFEAKFREPNPKLPFYITMAVLGAFAVGTVIYFWYQLRPPPSLINTNPKPPSDEKRLEAPPAQQSTALPGVPTAPTSAPAIPGLPGQSATPASAPKSPAASGTIATTPTNAVPNAAAGAPRQAPVPDKPATAMAAARETGRTSARGTGAAPRQASTSPGQQIAPSAPSKMSVNRRGPIVDPRVETAWQAYNQGDLATARSNYLAMLRADPMNRDALLGMAAVEIRMHRPEQAVGYYQSLLQANPRDTYAQAGLLSLRAHSGDAVQTESRVKNLLATDPDAQILHFTLGNQYAQQGRWPEAQQAYFKAYTTEPENPDFAYNLAVSLDQIRQQKQALEYYRRALSLAQQRASSFDQALARNRVQELTR